jgi:hypothetical protein
MCQAEIRCRQKQGSGREKVWQDQEAGRNDEQASTSCMQVQYRLPAGKNSRQVQNAARYKVQASTDACKYCCVQVQAAAR